MTDTFVPIDCYLPPTLAETLALSRELARLQRAARHGARMRRHARRGAEKAADLAQAKAACQRLNEGAVRAGRRPCFSRRGSFYHIRLRRRLLERKLA